MSKSEFVLLIPAIIYGVALVDLLKIFRHSKSYWEIIGWGIALFLNLIVSWFGLYEKLEILSSNILYFTAYIISPLVFAQAVFVLTPEEQDTDTKDYFLKSQKSFFMLLLLFTIINSLLSLIIESSVVFIWMRAVLIIPFIVVIFWPRMWLRASILALYYCFAIYIFINSLV